MKRTCCGVIFLLRDADVVPARADFVFPASLILVVDAIESLSRHVECLGDWLHYSTSSYLLTADSRVS